jgi:hypothetical protein
MAGESVYLAGARADADKLTSTLPRNLRSRRSSTTSLSSLSESETPSELDTDDEVDVPQSEVQPLTNDDASANHSFILPCVPRLALESATPVRTPEPESEFPPAATITPAIAPVSSSLGPAPPPPYASVPPSLPRRDPEPEIVEIKKEPHIAVPSEHLPGDDLRLTEAVRALAEPDMDPDAVTVITTYLKKYFTARVGHEPSPTQLDVARTLLAKPWIEDELRATLRRFYSGLWMSVICELTSVYHVLVLTEGSGRGADKGCDRFGCTRM